MKRLIATVVLLGMLAIFAATTIDLTTDVRGILPVANGGSGSASPSLVAGSNITITGSWPNQTIASSGGGGTGYAGVNAQTGTTYTTVLGDAGYLITMTNASSNTVTIPPNSSVAYTVGTIIYLAQTGAGQSSFAAGAGVTINTPTSLSCRAEYSTIFVTKLATDTWLVGGDTQ